MQCIKTALCVLYAWYVRQLPCVEHTCMHSKSMVYRWCQHHSICFHNLRLITYKTEINIYWSIWKKHTSESQTIKNCLIYVLPNSSVCFYVLWEIHYLNKLKKKMWSKANDIWLVHDAYFLNSMQLVHANRLLYINSIIGEIGQRCMYDCS